MANKSTKISLAFVLPLLFFAFFSSCSARIDGTFGGGGAADLTIRTSLEPRTLALIRSLQNFMGEEADDPVLDANAIGRSIAAVPGAGRVSLRNTSPSALEGIISISSVENFLTLGESRFIHYARGAQGASSIVILMERNSAPQLISLLSPEVVEYLSSLFAPVVTGDTSTRQEYLELVSSIYGRPLADEIAAARIAVRIEFPGPISAVQGGSFSGRRAEFNIPLVDILVLENPLRYEVRW